MTARHGVSRGLAVTRPGPAPQAPRRPRSSPSAPAGEAQEQEEGHSWPGMGAPGRRAVAGSTFPGVAGTEPGTGVPALTSSEHMGRNGTTEAPVVHPWTPRRSGACTAVRSPLLRPYGQERVALGLGRQGAGPASRRLGAQQLCTGGPGGSMEPPAGRRGWAGLWSREGRCAGPWCEGGHTAVLTPARDFWMFSLALAMSRRMRLAPFSCGQCRKNCRPALKMSVKK